MTAYRTLTALGCAILLAAPSSCVDFAHSNPFDPAMPVALTVTGPDSAFALDDTVRFSLSTNPEYAHETPTWSVELAPYPGSRPVNEPFLATRETSRPGEFVIEGYLGVIQGQAITVQIRAALGASRSATKLLTFQQRATHLLIKECMTSVTTATSSNSIEVPVGALFNLCALPLDRHGHLVDPPGPTTTNTVANPGVIGVRYDNGTARMVGLVSGSTWVYMTTPAVYMSSPALVDSVRVVVR